MSNYIEYNDKIAFHPGYYIKEIIEESGLSQKDFANRLDTTPKNLSILVRGEQSLSIDIAMKLSRMLGTSVEYWLNLQKSYDALIAEFELSKELEQERRIFKYFQYTYFRENFGLPDLPRKINEQIKCLREFLNVASLSVFTKQNMAVSFRSASEDMKEANIARANAMVQIAINQALKIEAPKFDKKKFEKAVDYALTLTTQHGDFYPLIRQAFEVGQEDAADKYAEDKLIPPGEYEAFVKMNEFSENAIRRFAERIDRDPGIVLGRLQNDQIVPFTNVALSKALKHKYKVITS